MSLKYVIAYDIGTTGLKTGFTSKAGYCLSATAQRDGLGLVAVVMGCATSQERFAACKSMLDYGFANYAVVPTAKVFAPSSVRARVFGPKDTLEVTVTTNPSSAFSRASVSSQISLAQPPMMAATAAREIRLKILFMARKRAVDDYQVWPGWTL